MKDLKSFWIMPAIGAVWGVLSAIYISLVAGPKVFGEYGLIHYLNLSDQIILLPALWINIFTKVTYGVFPDSFILLVLTHILGSAVIGAFLGAIMMLAIKEIQR